MRKNIALISIAGIGLLTSLCACGGGNYNEDVYEDDKLKVSFRNLYFNDYVGGDDYLATIEDKFGLKIETTAYPWSEWNEDVNREMMSRQVSDVFHANIDSYNFGTWYKWWAEDEAIKALPDDLSNWPNLKKMIDNTSNVDALKINGHLYGIPIAKNIKDYSTTFSPFTYVYRRDWAKQLGVYQENDVYTWDQFMAVIEAFRDNSICLYPFADVEWGFPSITNFYKQVPHCFAKDETGTYVNNYTTDEYIVGLNESRNFAQNSLYFSDESKVAAGTFNQHYYRNRVGVFYENLSYSNYTDLQANLRSTNPTENFNVDDASAIMKIIGTDGNYHLEGTDNWFSMTFFAFGVSDAKMEKILNLYDWLLSEEGTKYAIYGEEGYDYTVENGEIKLIESRWPRDKKTGEMLPKNNGARYLRYMVTLGYDTLSYDPLTNKDVVAYLDSWDAEMRAAQKDGHLTILKEDPEVMWMTTPEKIANSGILRTQALEKVSRYIFGNQSEEDYKNSFNTNDWANVLAEINEEVRK